MTPLAIFIRTLLRTSAVFIGTTMVFIHPPNEWAGGRTVSAVSSGREMAVDALMSVVNDSAAGVRRQVAASLGTSANPRALPALRMMLHDAEPAGAVVDQQDRTRRRGSGRQASRRSQ